MRIYVLTDDGYFTGLARDYPGKVCPGNATVEVPPDATEGFVVRFDRTARTWALVDMEEAFPAPPAPELADVRRDALARIDKATSAAILAGFDYDIDPGTGAAESLHFSYDSFDQQNFADSASVAMLAMSGTEGLPTSVTWNAYRNHSPESGGELVRLTLDPQGFLGLYTAGALAHKAVQMELGGQRKAAAEAAESVEALRALLAGWGL